MSGHHIHMRSCFTVNISLIVATLLTTFFSPLARGQPDFIANEFGWPGVQVGMTYEQARSVIVVQGFVDVSTDKTASTFKFRERATGQVRSLMLGRLPNGDRPYITFYEQESAKVSSQYHAWTLELAKKYGSPVSVRVEGGNTLSVYCHDKRVGVALTSTAALVGLTYTAEQSGLNPCLNAPSSRPFAPLMYSELQALPTLTSADPVPAPAAARNGGAEVRSQPISPSPATNSASPSPGPKPTPAPVQAQQPAPAPMPTTVPQQPSITAPAPLNAPLPHLIDSERDFHQNILNAATRCFVEDVVVFTALRNSVVKSDKPDFDKFTTRMLAETQIRISRNAHEPFIQRSLQMLRLDQSVYERERLALAKALEGEMNSKPGSDSWKQCTSRQRLFFICNSAAIDEVEKEKSCAKR